MINSLDIQFYDSCLHVDDDLIGEIKTMALNEILMRLYAPEQRQQVFIIWIKEPLMEKIRSMIAERRDSEDYLLMWNESDPSTLNRLDIALGS